MGSGKSPWRNDNPCKPYDAFLGTHTRLCTGQHSYKKSKQYLTKEDSSRSPKKNEGSKLHEAYYQHLIDMLYLGSLCLVACAELATQLLPCGLLQDSTVLFNPRTSLLVQKIHCQPRNLNSACLGTVKTHLYIVEMFENSSVYYEVWRNPAWQLFHVSLHRRFCPSFYALHWLSSAKADQKDLRPIAGVPSRIVMSFIILFRCLCII